MMLMRSLRDPQVQAAYVLVSERTKALAAGEPGAIGPAQDVLNFFDSWCSQADGSLVPGCHRWG
jgi:hypothetical protein